MANFAIASSPAYLKEPRTVRVFDKEFSVASFGKKSERAFLKIDRTSRGNGEFIVKMLADSVLSDKRHNARIAKSRAAKSVATINPFEKKKKPLPFSEEANYARIKSMLESPIPEEQIAKRAAMSVAVAFGKRQNSQTCSFTPTQIKRSNVALAILGISSFLTVSTLKPVVFGLSAIGLSLVAATYFEAKEILYRARLTTLAGSVKQLLEQHFHSEINKLPSEVKQ